VLEQPAPSFVPFLARVARWHIFKTKIPIWVKFWEFCNGRCLYILWPFCLFQGHLVYFVVIWYILWSFGIFFPFWICCTKKNLATLFLALKCLTHHHYYVEIDPGKHGDKTLFWCLFEMHCMNKVKIKTRSLLLQLTMFNRTYQARLMADVRTDQTRN
jgi:hypothetical protein